MVDKMTIMGKDLSEMIIAGRVCHLHEQASPQCLLVQPLGDHENDTLPNEIEEISAASPVPFVMVAFEIADWERDLMPWSDHAVSKRPEAGTGAVESFRYLLDGLLPWLKERYGELPVVLGGYSLAGAVLPLGGAGNKRLRRHCRCVTVDLDTELARICRIASTSGQAGLSESRRARGENTQPRHRADR